MSWGAVKWLWPLGCLVGDALLRVLRDIWQF
jgi:hypothetical protein